MALEMACGFLVNPNAYNHFKLLEFTGFERNSLSSIDIKGILHTWMSPAFTAKQSFVMAFESRLHFLDRSDSIKSHQCTN